MTPRIASILLAVTLAGCASGSSPAPGPAARATGLASQDQRITESSRRADHHTFEGVQERLRVLNTAGVPLAHYPLAKAQCWLDTARTQWHENDRTGYVEEALAEAIRLVEALEAKPPQPTGPGTALIAGSTRLRDDLWSRLQSFKAQPATLACTARTVACAEVRLVRAGHADQQTGWRAASTHVAMVEDALRLAEQQAARCSAAAGPAGAMAMPVTTPVVRPSGVPGAGPVSAPGATAR